MNKKQVFVIFVAIAVASVVADNKVHKKAKKAPVGVDEGSFSDHQHYHDGQHDSKYDQDAFLGEDQAKAMGDMNSDDVVEKLKVIFGKIDVDNDGKMSRKELVEWIVDNMKKHVSKNTKERMADYDTNNDGKVTWDEIAKVDYKSEGYGKEDSYPVDQKKRDEKRFKGADTDNDNALNADELALFLHPEESPRMTSVLVEENMEMMDKDGDGFISFEEYVKLDGQEIDKETEEAFKETFNKELDKNKDGKLDRDEVKEWILPGADQDPAAGEADHLIKEADSDKDNFLSLKELLEHKELFFGGRVTSYGELLTGNDEL